MAASLCGNCLSGNGYLQDRFHHDNELQHRAVYRRVVEGLDRRQLLAEVHCGLGAFPEKIPEVQCFEKFADNFQEGAPHRMFLVQYVGAVHNAGKRFQADCYLLHDALAEFLCIRVLLALQIVAGDRNWEVASQGEQVVNDNGDPVASQRSPRLLAEVVLHLVPGRGAHRFNHGNQLSSLDDLGGL